MAAKYWLKLYYEMLDDPKIGKLRAALRWRFIECLLVAGECSEGGYLPDVDEYAWRVRAGAESVETDFVSLADAGLLSQVDGRWYVTKFAERQEPVSGAERVARFRERQKKQEYYGDDTQPLPLGNDNVTKRYTDTDKIRSDIYIDGANAPNTHSGIDYELPPEETPNHNEQRQDMVTTIAAVVKTTYAIGMTSDDFERVADALIEEGITQEDVGKFGVWWKSNGNYQGKPALKSLLNEIKNCAVVTTAGEEFGTNAIRFDE